MQTDQVSASEPTSSPSLWEADSSLSKKVKEKLAAWKANPNVLRVVIVTTQGEVIFDHHPPGPMKDSLVCSHDFLFGMMQLNLIAKKCVKASLVASYARKLKCLSFQLDSNHVLVVATIPQGSVRKSLPRDLRWLHRNW